MILLKRRYFKHFWKVVIVLSGLAFILGQALLYIYFALQ